MKLDATFQEIKQRAESDFYFYCRLVQPRRLLGHCHIDVINWWGKPDAGSHQLLLFPRDHQKSALAGLRASWLITRNPAVRILYISSTANLAIKQLKFIKDILTSPIYRRYWPEMVNEDEGRREKWSETEISVDHPKRKEEYIRDPTVFACGLTTNVTGMHSDWNFLDDVVTNDTAYSEEGREKVRSQLSLLASVEGTMSRQCVVGTRYHPKDAYNDMMEMTVDKYDENGELVGQYKLYEVKQEPVETDGQFLWPMQKRADGAVFGFNQNVLARKRAQYLDKTQFYAQYYNDPNDLSTSDIPPDCFQYFERSHLKREAGKWYIKGRRLNVFAAIDFAYSLSDKADFTAIVVVGIDAYRNFYVLDIDRFKTKLIPEYYSHILRMHQKWDFRKLRAEITAGQDVIVEDLKRNYIQKHGLALSIDDNRPTMKEGAKEDRIRNALQPLYINRQMFHYSAGNSQILEDELIMKHPPHDDVKDALASCIPICVAPSLSLPNKAIAFNTDYTHSRFGGIL